MFKRSAGFQINAQMFYWSTLRHLHHKEIHATTKTGHRRISFYENRPEHAVGRKNPAPLWMFETLTGAGFRKISTVFLETNS
jgi:phenylalanyl-tRNA synthetase beta subunit